MACVDHNRSKSQKCQGSFKNNKTKGIHCHSNWSLDGSSCIGFLLMQILNDGHFNNLTLNHPDCAKNPIWYAFILLAWSKYESEYEAMHRVYQRAHEITGKF